MSGERNSCACLQLPECFPATLRHWHAWAGEWLIALQISKRKGAVGTATPTSTVFLLRKGMWRQRPMLCKDFSSQALTTQWPSRCPSFLISLRDPNHPTHVLEPNYTVKKVPLGRGSSLLPQSLEVWCGHLPRHMVPVPNPPYMLLHNLSVLRVLLLGLCAVRQQLAHLTSELVLVG